MVVKTRAAKIRNTIDSYRLKNHIDSIILRNKLKLMEDWGFKQSLVAVDSEKVYNQIVRILELARSAKVNLNSVLSDGIEYVRRIQLIDFHEDSNQFVWHFCGDKYFSQIPNQLFNKLAMKLNKAFVGLDILPMRLIIETAVPKYEIDTTDLQFAQTASGNYTIITYDSMNKCRIFHAHVLSDAEFSELTAITKVRYGMEAEFESKQITNAIVITNKLTGI